MIWGYLLAPALVMAVLGWGVGKMLTDGVP